VPIVLARKMVKATFSSQPANAEVWLKEQGSAEVKIGTTPITVDLKSYTTYSVQYQKVGFATQTEQIEVKDKTVTHAMTLPKPQPASRTRKRVTMEEGVVSEDTRTLDRFMDDEEVEPDVSIEEAPVDFAPLEGTLSVMVKPPCQIYIEDELSNVAEKPIRKLKLPAGKFRVRLVNESEGIDELITVKIVPGKAERIIRDYTKGADAP
jgi:hypothetical protein